MDRPHLQVLDGTQGRDEGFDESPVSSAQPHPLSHLEPPSELKHRILGSIRALDAEMKSPRLALEPLAPPVSLKRRIFRRLADLDVPAAHTRATVPATRSARAATALFPTRRSKVFALGAVVLLLLQALAMMKIHAARREVERQALEAYRAAEEAREAEMAAREAEREAMSQLAQAQAMELRRQEAQRAEARARWKLAEAYARLTETNEDLSEALKQARIAQWRARVAKKNADKHAEAARLAEANALRQAMMVRERLERQRERIAFLEAQLGAAAKELE